MQVRYDIETRNEETGLWHRSRSVESGEGCKLSVLQGRVNAAAQALPMYDEDLFADVRIFAVTPRPGKNDFERKVIWQNGIWRDDRDENDFIFEQSEQEILSRVQHAE